MRTRLIVVIGGVIAASFLGQSPQAQTAPAGAARPGPDILYAAPATSPQLENNGIWRAAPILVSGTSVYRSGEFVYQDYLYDDRGAATRAVYPMPREKYADNAADFVEVRLKPLASELAIRVTLNSMIDPSLAATIIALGDKTPGAKLPFGAGGTMPATVFVTVRGATATVTDAASGQPVAAKATSTVDLRRRQIDVRVPYSAFDPRNQSAVRVAAGVGLWDAAKNAFMPPLEPAPNAPPPADNDFFPAGAAGARAGGARAGGGGGGRGQLAPLPAERSYLFNLAFRFNEQPNVNSMLPFYYDTDQAAVLASGNLSRFFATVDFVKLAAGRDDDSGIPKTGPMARIVVSHFEPAQGRGTAVTLGPPSRTDAECTPAHCIPQFAGRLQPYGIYIPTKTPPASGYGLTLDLHSAGATYGRWLGQNRYEQLGERGTGSIVITPNARAQGSGYYNEAAADVFEVWADVERRYKIDRDYVSIAGVSMGAIGGYRLAAMFPDLFAALAVSVGCPSFMYDAHRYVAAFIHTGDLDTQTNCNPKLDMLQAYIADGPQVQWWNFIEQPHGFSNRPRDWKPFAEFLGMRKRATDPPRVIYYVNSMTNQPKYGVNADHAYWVSGLTMRDPKYGGKVSTAIKEDIRSAWAPYGRIEVFSYGMGKGDPARNPVVKTSGTYHFGITFPWPNYDSQTVTWGATPSVPVRNVLDITAENIASVTVDPARAKVTCDATVNVKSDGPINVKMLGCAKVNVRTQE